MIIELNAVFVLVRWGGFFCVTLVERGFSSVPTARHHWRIAPNWFQPASPVRRDALFSSIVSSTSASARYRTELCSLADTWFATSPAKTAPPSSAGSTNSPPTKASATRRDEWSWSALLWQNSKARSRKTRRTVTKVCFWVRFFALYSEVALFSFHKQFLQDSVWIKSTSRDMDGVLLA